MNLTHGSLFSGVGGFEIGAQRAGIETLWNCEKENFQRRILKKLFPNVPQYEDVTTMLHKGYINQSINESINQSKPRYVDIISGGFPCQDISVAGDGIGITGTRSGLWSEQCNIIRTLGPLYAIIENSPALLIRGFEKVLCDLFEIGYHAEWECIRNSSFGYPHRRERIYIIAYTNKIGIPINLQTSKRTEKIFKQWASNTPHGYSVSEGIHQMPEIDNIRNGDGVSGWSHRVGSIGNAVNPTVAYYLFECIKRHYAENGKR